MLHKSAPRGFGRGSPPPDHGDEHAVLPVGSFNPTYGTTLSMPSVLGRTGVTRVLEPEMSEDEMQALQLSATRLREAVARLEV